MIIILHLTLIIMITLILIIMIKHSLIFVSVQHFQHYESPMPRGFMFPGPWKILEVTKKSIMFGIKFYKWVHA